MHTLPEKDVHPTQFLKTDVAFGVAVSVALALYSTEDVQVAPQPAARPAVVRHGDDRSEVGGVLLQPAQQVGKAGAAADRDDPRPAVSRAVLVDEVHEVALALTDGQQRVRQRPVELPPREDRERERR